MKVSIITVVFNSAATIADAMESVLRQSYPDIEYIVVDGGSNDGTLDLIRQYADKFAGRMKWISGKDKGIYDAMNKGIRLATGEVVGILNSDDFFSSHEVVSTMAKLFIDDVDAVYGDVHFVREGNLKKTIRYYSGRIFRPWMVRFGFIPPHPSLYVRKNIITRYGAYDDTYKISADFELIARLCYIHKIRAKYLHLDFVTMRTGGASTQSLKARRLGTYEDLVACRQLGIKTNIVFIYMKYFIKVTEALLIRS